MAIIHADNFSIYGTDTSLMLNGIYASIQSDGASSDASLVLDPDGVSPGRVFRARGGANNTLSQRLRYVLPLNTDVVGVSTRIWLSRLTDQAESYPLIASFCSSGNSTLFTVGVNSTGRLVVLQGLSTVLYETPSPVVTANGWYHVETRCKIDPSEGEIEIRVEGRTVVFLENINTGTTLIGQVRLGDIKNNYSFTDRFFTYYKDFVIWDGTGDRNNDFLGTVLVQNLEPSADVQLNWTPSTGDNGYSILRSIPPNDSDYISAEDDPLPGPYVAELTSLPEDITSVRGLITFVRAAKSDGGDGSIQVGLISSPDDDPATVLGENRPITVAQTYWRDVFETDPKTGSGWTPEAVNNVHLQITRTM